jgi:hypothetical protein
MMRKMIKMKMAHLPMNISLGYFDVFLLYILGKL